MTLIARPAGSSRAVTAPSRPIVAGFAAAMARAGDSLKATLREIAESGQLGPSSELATSRDTGARA